MIYVFAVCVLLLFAYDFVTANKALTARIKNGDKA